MTTPLPLETAERAFGEWKVVGASVAGSSHEKAGTACQDAHCWQSLPGKGLILAVADGAGSALSGGDGAQIASQIAVKALAAGIAQVQAKTYPWPQLLTQALDEARTAVAAEATRRQAPLREFATTLIVGIASPGLVAAAQIGDGALILADAQGCLQPLTAPVSDEYVNETLFLTSDDAPATAQITVWEGNAARLAVFSDGLQRLALRMPDGQPHEPFFAPLFRFLEAASDRTASEEQLTQFLRSPRIAARTDDDLTLLLAMPT